MSALAFDAVIAGAGIVGAACADELARRGMRVCVVERDTAGSGATAAGMGHLVVMDDSEAQFALTRYSQQLWSKLACELPADVEYDACGTIWVAADEEEMAEVWRKQAFYTTRGVPAEAIEARALSGLEPSLRGGLAGGLMVPEDAVLYPPNAARFLINRARQHGAEVVAGMVVEMRQGRIRLANGTEIFAAVLVNATGTYSPALTPGLDVRKRKGHLVITDRYPAFVRHQLVELGYIKRAHATPGDSCAFNVQPRRTGQLLIGSSRQFGAEDAQIDRLMLSRMLKAAVEYLPGLGPLSAIRAWTGFRPATSDNLPLIGPWPEDESVYLATGHEGLGITTSLATARLLADQLTGGKPAIPMEPYLPSRAFAGRVHG
jgi:glycine/D-amino acid oxidase-like deaminating enzyme